MLAAPWKIVVMSLPHSSTTHHDLCHAQNSPPGLSTQRIYDILKVEILLQNHQEKSALASFLKKNLRLPKKRLT
jgi:hypothetical protein